MDYLMWIATIPHMDSPDIKIRRASIRFGHIVRGFEDIPAKAFREGTLMKGITKNNKAQR